MQDAGIKYVIFTTKHHDGILKKARQQHPGLIAVDRSIRGKNENYQTPERGIPETQLNYPWESCITLSNDWGWTPNAPYKPAEKVISTLAEIVAKGGCYLLGVGPTPDGVIEQPVVDRLHKVGQWLRKNGEAIYHTRTTPLYNDGKTWFTAAKDGKTLYAIYTLEEGEQLPATISWTGNVPRGKMVLLCNGKRKVIPSSNQSLLFFQEQASIPGTLQGCRFRHTISPRHLKHLLRGMGDFHVLQLLRGIYPQGSPEMPCQIRH